MALLELEVQALELGLGRVALRELAHDQHGLLAGLDDARLEVAEPAVELETVLARDDLAGVDRASDALDERVGHVFREDVVRGGPDQLVGRHGEILGRPLELEVDAVPGHAEHEVGQGVEERAVAGLGLGKRRMTPLALERESGSRGRGLDEERVLLERAMVDERGHRAALALDHGHELLPVGLGQLDRVPVEVGERPRLGDPVGQPQGRVAEGAGQRFA